jgi:hypothetical protein
LASDNRSTNLPTDDPRVTTGRHHLLPEAYGCRWYRVGALDYLLQRSDIDKEDAQAKLGSGARTTSR